MSDIVAVIPAAGLGTRFLPFTRTVSKELLPVLNKPSLHYIFEELAAAGVTRVVMVTREGKDDLQRCCNIEKNTYDALLSQNFPALDEWRELLSQLSISWVYQKFPGGLGHAILCAENEARGATVLVALPDVIMDCPVSCSRQLIGARTISGQGVIATHQEMRHPLSNYGVLEVAQQTGQILALKRLIEKPDSESAPSNWIVSGRYLLPSDIFSILRDTQPDRRGEIQLTDALNDLAWKNRLSGFAFDGRTLDMGNVAGWLEANIHFASKKPAYNEILASLVGDLNNPA